MVVSWGRGRHFLPEIRRNKSKGSMKVVSGMKIWGLMPKHPYFLLQISGFSGSFPTNISEVLPAFSQARWVTTCHGLSHMSNHYSPGHHSFVSLLLTIQGSFPCSNKEITSGLEWENPVQERKKGPSYVVSVPKLKSVHDYQERGVSKLRVRGKDEEDKVWWSSQFLTSQGTKSVLW